MGAESKWHTVGTTGRIGIGGERINCKSSRCVGYARRKVGSLLRLWSIIVPHKGETTTYFAWDNCRVCAALATTARRRSSKRVASIQRLVSMAGHSIPVTQSTDTTSAE